MVHYYSDLLLTVGIRRGNRGRRFTLRPRREVESRRRGTKDGGSAGVGSRGNGTRLRRRGGRARCRRDGWGRQGERRDTNPSIGVIYYDAADYRLASTRQSNFDL